MVATRERPAPVGFCFTSIKAAVETVMPDKLKRICGPIFTHRVSAISDMKQLE